MNQPIIIDSKLPGPVAVILGGIHGNETCGVEALAVLKGVVLKKGKLILIYGNPKAIAQNVRYAEQNLNRMFCSQDLLTAEMQMSYEFTRSREILPYLDEATYSLDLHASFTPESEPFIICERNALNIVQYFPQRRICYGFTTLEPGGTDGYMNQMGKVGICVECGYLGDPKSTQSAIYSAEMFLKSLDMIDAGALIANKNQEQVEVYELYYTKTAHFRLSRLYDDFDSLKRGELIAYDGNNPVYSSKDQMILFARNRDQIHAEAFLLGEKLS